MYLLEWEQFPMREGVMGGEGGQKTVIVAMGRTGTRLKERFQPIATRERTGHYDLYPDIEKS